MTPIQFLTSKEHGCCTTGELLQMSKVDKPGVDTLKEWAKAEMKNKGIELTEK